MTVVYAALPGTIIRRKSSHISFCHMTKDGTEIEISKKPIDQLEVIYVFGKIPVTSEAQRLCMRNGVDISYFNNCGRMIGSILSTRTKCADLKFLQFQNFLDPIKRQEFANNIVAGKIQNQIATIKYLSRKANINSDAVNDNLFALNKLRNEALACTNNETLLGIEGSASREYFSLYSLFFTTDLKFIGRRKRPATDPVNAMLSLGYTMLTNVLAGFIAARGLEPSIGYLHAVHPSRESLALDLVEQFRAPIIDRFIAKICNLKKFTSDMFRVDPESGATNFAEKYIHKFFQIWDEMLHKEYTNVAVAGNNHQVHSLLELLIYQVDEYVKSLREGRNYNSYMFKFR